MPDTSAFIANYTDANRSSIAFAWNGKHASEFIDANQAFRWDIANECIADPSQVPLNLLEALFLADAEWARQAWGSPRHFARLGTALLEHGKDAAIPAFPTGFCASFDTFGACHEITLAPELLTMLTATAKEMLSEVSNDEIARNRLEATLTLFQKMADATAARGWVSLAPGTPVSDIEVIWPRWYHKLWHWLIGRGPTATK